MQARRVHYYGARMALRTYLATEIALDHADGLLTRRDALHKLGLLGLTTAAASTVSYTHLTLPTN